jgi:hypothetical protein
MVKMNLPNEIFSNSISLGLAVFLLAKGKKEIRKNENEAKLQEYFELFCLNTGLSTYYQSTLPFI